MVCDFCVQKLFYLVNAHWCQYSVLGTHRYSRIIRLLQNFYRLFTDYYRIYIIFELQKPCTCKMEVWKKKKSPIFEVNLDQYTWSLADLENPETA